MKNDKIIHELHELVHELHEFFNILIKLDIKFSQNHS